LKTRTTTLTLAAAAVAAVSLAAPAQAYREVMTTTVVTWSGGDCIAYESTNVFNPYTTGYNSQCSAAHQLTWYRYASSGEMVGVNPIMGGNDWIACHIVVDGVTEWSDYAEAGDGTDVNCLREVRW